MWCSSSDTPKTLHGTQPHHRIVRIPPGESVVLNSAERAPYLLLIEILNDDLDFEPTRRGNKEVLKKIATKENERAGTSRDLVPFGNPPVPRHHPQSPSFNGSDVVRGINPSLQTMPLMNSPQTSAPVAFPSEDEEIDLVEQLFGSDQSLLSRPVDLSDSIVLPPAPKNKELEMAAWSRSSSSPSTPAIDYEPSTAQLPLSATPRINRSPHSSSPSTTSGNHEVTSTSSDPNRVLSLDEYSERMRTAAIMLAQLNANLFRENVTTAPQPGAAPGQSNPQPPNSASWLLGSSWLGDQSSAKQPVAPLISRGLSEHSQASSRMRLQHAEAAAIRDRIMKEMLSLEEERMQRMRENREDDGMMRIGDISGSMKSAEDEGIIRRELNKADPSAVVFSESWTAKKVQLLPILLVLN